jgi:hypothetical protein
MSAVAKWVPAAVALLAGVLVLALSPAGLAKKPLHSVSCNVSVGSGTSPENEPVPAELAGPLEAGILAKFAVLRRAALPSDQLPALSPVGLELDSQLASYYPGFVRQVKALADGGRYFLIPGFLRQQSIPPARCLPAALRQDRPRLVAQEHKLASEPVYCIVEVGHEDPGSQCEPFAAIEESARVFEPDLSEEEAIAELVPDGVASVRVSYETAAPVVATTAENVYTLIPPRGLVLREHKRLAKLSHRLEHDRHATKAEQRRLLHVFLKAIEKAIAEAEPRKVEWLDSAGELVRSIAPPSTGASNLAAGVLFSLKG